MNLSINGPDVWPDSPAPGMLLVLARLVVVLILEFWATGRPASALMLVLDDHDS